MLECLAGPTTVPAVAYDRQSPESDHREYRTPHKQNRRITNPGLLFADSVYEGFGILDGQILDFAYHMQRLARSLDQLNIPAPMRDDEMLAMLMRLVRDNAAEAGFLYLQITRVICR